LLIGYRGSWNLSGLGPLT